MSVHTKKHVKCEGCGLEAVFDHMNGARQAGWLTVTVRPVDLSANDASAVWGEVCSVECASLWASDKGSSVHYPMVPA